MNTPNDTRMKYDNSSYQEQLERSIFPGIYSLITPHNDCNECNQSVSNDPFLRYQNYGHHTCTMKKAIDDLNELNGLNYKNSKCNKDAYSPNSYISTGCKPKTNNDIRKCSIPTESCRLSNPPCTLKETGINRFDPLCWNPQDKAIECHDRIGINYRMVAKDNHVPLIERPETQERFFPDNKEDELSKNNLDNWASINKKNFNYSPGYPYNNPSYLLHCKQQINSY
jgi:hypothetical protein